MPEADAYEVASEEDVWVLHWRLLSGAQEAASTVIQDRQPEANGKEALDTSQGLSASTTAAESTTTDAADCSDIGTSSPDASDKISAVSIDSKPDAGLELGEAAHPEKGTCSTDAGGTASARSSVASSSSSADSCSTSANGRSKAEQTPSTSKPSWLRQGTPSTGTDLSQEVTDNDECESSDADSRGTRSTQTSLEEILDTSLHAEGAVYSRQALLQLRPGGAPCATPPAAAPPRAAPEQQTVPGPGPPRVAARPPAAARPSHTTRQQRGPTTPSLVSPTVLDDHSTALAASILQAELVLEALLSEEPTSASEGSTAAAMLSAGTAAGGRPALTTLMLRNIPNRSTRMSLQRQLDQMGFKGEYDLVYVPVDRLNKNNSLGYAFINFRTATSSSRFASRFHGAPARELFPESSTGKVLGVCYAEVQGREAYMERSSCPGPPRFIGCADEADCANRARFALTPEGWALRETWAPWPWVLHPNQRISIVDSLPAPACAWVPAVAMRPPQQRIPRGRGALLSAMEVAASRGRGALGLCAEAPEFVPTLVHSETMGCNPAVDMQMSGEAFEMPSPYAVETPMMRYLPHELPPSVLLPSAQWPVPGVLLPSAQWPVQGDMTTCSFWDSVETPMTAGHGACYEGHESPTPSGCGHWPYADFGAALA